MGREEKHSRLTETLESFYDNAVRDKAYVKKLTRFVMEMAPACALCGSSLNAMMVGQRIVYYKQSQEQFDQVLAQA